MGPTVAGFMPCGDWDAAIAAARGATAPVSSVVHSDRCYRVTPQQFDAWRSGLAAARGLIARVPAGALGAALAACGLGCGDGWFGPQHPRFSHVARSGGEAWAGGGDSVAAAVAAAAGSSAAALDALVAVLRACGAACGARVGAQTDGGGLSAAALAAMDLIATRIEAQSYSHGDTSSDGAVTVTNRPQPLEFTAVALRKPSSASSSASSSSSSSSSSSPSSLSPSHGGVGSGTVTEVCGRLRKALRFAFPVDILVAGNVSCGPATPASAAPFALLEHKGPPADAAGESVWIRIAILDRQRAPDDPAALAMPVRMPASVAASRAAPALCPAGEDSADGAQTVFVVFRPGHTHALCSPIPPRHEKPLAKALAAALGATELKFRVPVTAGSCDGARAMDPSLLWHLLDGQLARGAFDDAAAGMRLRAGAAVARARAAQAAVDSGSSAEAAGSAERKKRAATTLTGLMLPPPAKRLAQEPGLSSWEAFLELKKTDDLPVHRGDHDSTLGAEARALRAKHGDGRGCAFLPSPTEWLLRSRSASRLPRWLRGGAVRRSGRVRGQCQAATALLV